MKSPRVARRLRSRNTWFVFFFEIHRQACVVGSHSNSDWSRRRHRTGAFWNPMGGLGPTVFLRDEGGKVGAVLSTPPVPPLAPPSLPRSAAGYSRKATDEFIAELTDFYEAIWLERKRLQERVEALEVVAAEHDELKREVERLQAALDAQAKRQQLVTGALYSAERFAESIKEEARREAEAALRKARRQGEELVAEALREREALQQETIRLQALAQRTRADLAQTLMSALDHLEGDSQSRTDAKAAGGPEAVVAGDPAEPK
jgi:cell division septum initiation protein DivIVA